MPELELSPELHLVRVVLVDDVGLDRGDLAPAAREVDQPAIADDRRRLFLARLPILERDQVEVAERSVGFEPELGGDHHALHDRRRRALEQLRGSACRPQDRPDEPLGFQHRRGDLVQPRQRLLEQRTQPLVKLRPTLGESLRSTASVLLTHRHLP